MKLQQLPLVSGLGSHVTPGKSHVSGLMSLLLLAVAALAWSGWAGTLDLAVRGRAPEYAIVRAADASPSVKYAAEELRDFTEKMTKLIDRMIRENPTQWIWFQKRWNTAPEHQKKNKHHTVSSKEKRG